MLHPPLCAVAHLDDIICISFIEVIPSESGLSRRFAPRGRKQNVPRDFGIGASISVSA